MNNGSLLAQLKAAPLSPSWMALAQAYRPTKDYAKVSFRLGIKYSLAVISTMGYMT
jgi:hypothetical protein